MSNILTMGHIKLYRKIQNWEWYGDPLMVALWVHLLLNANWEDGEWRGEQVLRGQLITSVANLSHETGLSVSQVRLCLERLEGSKQIIRKTTSKWTKITICEYDSYQGVDTPSSQTNDTQITRQSATIKEDKNARNQEVEKKTSFDVKEKRKVFVKPTIDEVRAYCYEHGYDIDAEYFVAYYESKGWLVGKTPMKSWQACVVTWVKKRQESGGLFYTPTKPERVYPGGIKPQDV